MDVELCVYIEIKNVEGVNEDEVEKNARRLGRQLLDTLDAACDIEQVVFLGEFEDEKEDA